MGQPTSLDVFSDTIRWVHTPGCALLPLVSAAAPSSCARALALALPLDPAPIAFLRFVLPARSPFCLGCATGPLIN